MASEAALPLAQSTLRTDPEVFGLPGFGLPGLSGSGKLCLPAARMRATSSFTCIASSVRTPAAGEGAAKSPAVPRFLVCVPRVGEVARRLTSSFMKRRLISDLTVMT